MKHHQKVDALIAEAQDAHRCLYATTAALRSALGRRADAHELQRVAPNLYAAPDYWKALNPPEQSLHIARALTLKHPKWVFAGLTAASVHGLEHQWLLHDGTVTILSNIKGAAPVSPLVNRIYAPSLASQSVGDLPVTDVARTVVDCGRMLEFRYALPIVNSALKLGVTLGEVLAACNSMHLDCAQMFPLLHWATPACENGGESLAYGTILQSGLMAPAIQQEFVDPQTGKVYRVDFAWHLADGRIVVGEFDGTDKYVNPDMTNRRSIQGVVFAEREREQGLMRADVDTIVRFTFDDVVNVDPFISKLTGAGIPRHDHGIAQLSQVPSGDGASRRSAS